MEKVIKYKGFYHSKITTFRIAWSQKQYAQKNLVPFAKTANLKSLRLNYILSDLKAILKDLIFLSSILKEPIELDNITLLKGKVYFN